MKNILLTILLSLFIFSPVLAEDKLPDVMVGQTTVEKIDASSLDFNGQNYVQIPNISNLASGNFTAMFWIKSTVASTNPGQTIISAGRLATDSTCNSSTTGWAVGIVQNAIRVSFCDGTSLSLQSTSPISNLNNNSWHHIAVTRSSSGQIIFYFDGAAQRTVTGVTGSLFNSAQMITVGASSSGFTDTVDEVRLYDAVIPSSNVSWSASSTNGSTDWMSSNLKGWWSFDEGESYITTDDRSANSYDGVLQKGASSSLPTWNSTSVFYTNIKTYYGGYTGNEAVFNYNSSGKTVGTKVITPSASFNGSSSYIDAGQAPDITGTGGFTISVWIKRTRTVPNPTKGWLGNEYIISQGSNFGNYILYINSTNGADNDTVGFRTYGSSGENTCGPGVSLGFTSSTKIPYNDSTWHNIVVKRNSGGTSGELWIDGRLDVSGSGSAVYVKKHDPTDCTSGAALSTQIGRNSFQDSGNGRGYFNGVISTVRTYNRSLTSGASGQIASLYNESSVPTDTKLYLKLNDASSTIKDSSSNNYTGITFNNSAWSDDGPLTSANESDGLFGFNKSSLDDCAESGVLPDPAKCFKRNTNGAGSVTVMNSKTAINDAQVIEIATILYPSKTVIGDVYGTLSNFAFWGKSVNQNPSGTANSEAAYGLSNYAINSNAQAKWGGTEFTKNDAKIDILKGEAPTLTSASIGSVGIWYMQSTTNIGNSDQGDTSKTPEGKVWYVNGNLTISNTKTYRGKGTIIVNGNLTINSGVDIRPYASGQNRLGFIVIGAGNVTAAGNNKINAAIYCKNTITVNGSNSDFTGSFVANAFGGLTGSNIRFYYDYAFDEAWPPGFKYLNMPHAEVK
ncbi:MAG: LamG domain-containing protein [Patescibacteria group bacterium]